MPNLYLDPSQKQLALGVEEPQISEKELQEDFEEFYIDMWEELSKYGSIDDVVVCSNLGEHLLGNVYVKFYEEQSAEDAVNDLKGRFYDKRPILPEFSPVTNFREAKCRQFEKSGCNRGGFCNFMHMRPIDRSLKNELIRKYGRSSGSRSRSRSRDRYERSRSRDRYERSRSRDRRRSRSRDRYRRSRSRDSYDRHRSGDRYDKDRRSRERYDRSRSKDRKSRERRSKDRYDDKRSSEVNQKELGSDNRSHESNYNRDDRYRDERDDRDYRYRDERDDRHKDERHRDERKNRSKSPKKRKTSNEKTDDSHHYGNNNSNQSKTQKRSRCFFDIEIDTRPAGRIVFELYDDITPLTSKNFLALCTGSHGIGKHSGKPLHYKGSKFHRIIPEFMVQGGDITLGNGRGGESIYGPSFKDENFHVKHDKPFLLSMANCGKDTNSSQFFLTTVVCDWLDNKHTVFGEVIEGTEIVKKIEEEGTAKGTPLRSVVISNCGEI